MKSCRWELPDVGVAVRAEGLEGLDRPCRSSSTRRHEYALRRPLAPRPPPARSPSCQNSRLRLREARRTSQDARVRDRGHYGQRLACRCAVMTRWLRLGAGRRALRGRRPPSASHPHVDTDGLEALEAEWTPFSRPERWAADTARRAPSLVERWSLASRHGVIRYARGRQARTGAVVDHRVRHHGPAVFRRQADWRPDMAFRSLVGEARLARAGTQACDYRQRLGPVFAGAADEESLAVGIPSLLAQRSFSDPLLLSRDLGRAPGNRPSFFLASGCVAWPAALRLHEGSGGREVAQTAVYLSTGPPRGRPVPTA